MNSFATNFKSKHVKSFTLDSESMGYFRAENASSGVADVLGDVKYKCRSHSHDVILIFYLELAANCLTVHFTQTV